MPVNHSQSDEISCLKLFVFFQHPYFDKRYRYCQHRCMTQFRLMSVVNHLHILGRGGADSCGTPQFISPASEKIFHSVTKTFYLRDVIETI